MSHNISELDIDDLDWSEIDLSSPETDSETDRTHDSDLERSEFLRWKGYDEGEISKDEEPYSPKIISTKKPFWSHLSDLKYELTGEEETFLSELEYSKPKPKPMSQWKSWADYEDLQSDSKDPTSELVEDIFDGDTDRYMKVLIHSKISAEKCFKNMYKDDKFNDRTGGKCNLRKIVAHKKVFNALISPIETACEDDSERDPDYTRENDLGKAIYFKNPHLMHLLVKSKKFYFDHLDSQEVEETNNRDQRHFFETRSVHYPLLSLRHNGSGQINFSDTDNDLIRKLWRDFVPLSDIS